MTKPDPKPMTWVLPSPSLISLLGANLVVFGLALYEGWDTFPLLYLFWLENVVIGLFSLLRILFAEPSNLLTWGKKLFLGPFFALHYGLFTTVHGMFVLVLFGTDLEPTSKGPLDPVQITTILSEHALWPAFCILAASHGLSFFWNYLIKGEFETADVETLMTAPYARVIVLHLGIIAGGALLLFLGSPSWALLILAAMKIYLDGRAHLSEHRRLQGTGKHEVAGLEPAG